MECLRQEPEFSGEAAVNKYVRHNNLTTTAAGDSQPDTQEDTVIQPDWEDMNIVDDNDNVVTVCKPAIPTLFDLSFEYDSEKWCGLVSMSMTNSLCYLGLFGNEKDAKVAVSKLNAAGDIAKGKERKIIEAIITKNSEGEDGYTTSGCEGGKWCDNLGEYDTTDAALTNIIHYSILEAEARLARKARKKAEAETDEGIARGKAKALESNDESDASDEGKQKMPLSCMGVYIPAAVPGSRPSSAESASTPSPPPYLSEFLYQHCKIWIEEKGGDKSQKTQSTDGTTAQKVGKWASGTVLGHKESQGYHILLDSGLSKWSLEDPRNSVVFKFPKANDLKRNQVGPTKLRDDFRSTRHVYTSGLTASRSKLKVPKTNDLKINQVDPTKLRGNFRSTRHVYTSGLTASRPKAASKRVTAPTTPTPLRPIYNGGSRTTAVVWSSTATASDAASIFFRRTQKSQDYMLPAGVKADQYVGWRGYASKSCIKVGDQIRRNPFKALQEGLKEIGLDEIGTVTRIANTSKGSHLPAIECAFIRPSEETIEITVKPNQVLTNATRKVVGLIDITKEIDVSAMPVATPATAMKQHLPIVTTATKSGRHVKLTSPKTVMESSTMQLKKKPYSFFGASAVEADSAYTVAGNSASANVNATTAVVARPTGSGSARSNVLGHVKKSKMVSRAGARSSEATALPSPPRAVLPPPPPPPPSKLKEPISSLEHREFVKVLQVLGSKETAAQSEAIFRSVAAPVAAPASAPSTVTPLNFPEAKRLFLKNKVIAKYLKQNDMDEGEVGMVMEVRDPGFGNATVALLEKVPERGGWLVDYVQQIGRGSSISPSIPLATAMEINDSNSISGSISPSTNNSSARIDRGSNNIDSGGHIDSEVSSVGSGSIDMSVLGEFSSTNCDFAFVCTTPTVKQEKIASLVLSPSRAKTPIKIKPSVVMPRLAEVLPVQEDTDTTFTCASIE